MNRKSWYAISLALYFIFTIFPIMALAQASPTSSQGLWQDIPFGSPESIQLCHLFVFIRNIVTFIIFILAPILAVLFLMVAGVLYVLSDEDVGNITKAKEILRSVLIGILITYGAWLLVDLFLIVMGAADWTGLNGGWFKIRCN
ncbi:MAG TPA: hypothetical protein PKM84_01545 [Candidatus Pacearchaeota archaeon]|nr:hypothetical protein [Candidatus Pacearchaeota archaeon]